eukprot:COSAG03_NODE_16281_length_406_cov_1.407166_1_plen_55_part_10
MSTIVKLSKRPTLSSSLRIAVTSSRFDIRLFLLPRHSVFAVSVVALPAPLQTDVN